MPKCSWWLCWSFVYKRRRVYTLRHPVGTDENLVILLLFVVKLIQQIKRTLPGSPPGVLCLFCIIISRPLSVMLVTGSQFWLHLWHTCRSSLSPSLSGTDTGNVCLPLPVVGSLDFWRCWQRIKQHETTTRFCNPPVVLCEERMEKQTLETCFSCVVLYSESLCWCNSFVAWYHESGDVLKFKEKSISKTSCDVKRV